MSELLKVPYLLNVNNSKLPKKDYQVAGRNAFKSLTNVILWISAKKRKENKIIFSGEPTNNRRYPKPLVIINWAK